MNKDKSLEDFVVKNIEEQKRRQQEEEYRRLLRKQEVLNIGIFYFLRF